MSNQSVPVLLVTANVGSIFEEPGAMLKIWTDEFLSTISRLDPKFIALHCQEVGGKNYEQSMRHVEDFVKLLSASEELQCFDRIKVFLDEDFSSAEHFTALGNLYFVHESLKDVLVFDFKECAFVPINGKEIHSGNIETVTTKEKAKFPQDFFPECKWSRKGFLRTRWSISGTVFDLINIHLFHDASNFIAMEESPSVYSKTRRRALEHTLDRFHNDHYPNVPFFLFGDCNFRTDTCGVIKKLTTDTQENKQMNKGNTSKLQYRDKNDDLILSLGKKEFSHQDHQKVFVEDSCKWLQEFDRELEDFKDRLYEFPIKFVPSYPFTEDVKEGSSYMKTRVPAWCDRVLLSSTAKSLVKNISSPDAIDYGIIGEVSCMGDHKPVYLRFQLISNKGVILCCGPGRPANLCNYSKTFLDLQKSPWPPNLMPCNLNPNLLQAAMPVPEPYTPDSVDSPSPGAPPGGNASAWEPSLLKSRLESIADEQQQHHKNHNQLCPSSPRRCRSNEDLMGWQRAQLLTRAWLEGEAPRGYRSFCGGPRHGKNNVGNNNLLVPKIAVVDASTVGGSETLRSQETSVGKLKLKACGKVTERCKRNIAARKGRCWKCCVLS